MRIGDIGPASVTLNMNIFVTSTVTPNVNFSSRNVMLTSVDDNLTRLGAEWDHETVVDQIASRAASGRHPLPPRRHTCGVSCLGRVPAGCRVTGPLGDATPTTSGIAGKGGYGF
jgi:hypothetical protein